jgi:single-stranded-DNA-specific exonuclease
MDKGLTISRLRRELDLPECLARVLVRNGFGEPALADSFLQPRLKNLSDPFLLPNMEAAARRVLLALERNEKIALYGDYDVDGVTSLALLHRILTSMGGRVAAFLPHRIEEGYGLSPSGVERCMEEHAPQLLIAVDCGTNSAAEVAQFYAAGAEVVILDHHEPSSHLPRCEALVNPKLDGHLSYLCSAGVCFKLAHALLKISPHPEIDLKEYLDLVALATVADIVPLIAENRILVHRGLHQMGQTRWPGLRALMSVADVNTPVQSSDIGFRLGPRINASGRLGTALESLRLLLSNDAREAARLADSLDQQNRERQGVERSLIQEVDAWVAQHYDSERDACIVAGQRDWHHGVLGIVAARVMRRYHRPTLLVGFDEDGLGKGSGRSIEGISLVEALSQCAEHLDKFGGHEMAAGVTVRQDRFESFRDAFRQTARSLVNTDILTPKLRLDAELLLDDISFTLLDHQQRLEPYGAANLQPIFAARGITPSGSPRVLKEKHLKLEFQSGRQKLGAIFFNGAAEPLPRPPWDVAFTIERNEYNGRTDVQIQVVAIRSAA